MTNQKRNIAPALESLRQEYLTAVSNLYSDQSLSPGTRPDRMHEELATEYRRRRAEELEAIEAQQRADAEVPGNLGSEELPGE